MESREPPWSFVGVDLDSMWTSPSITLRLLGVHMESTWTPHGVYIDSLWSPHNEETFPGVPVQSHKDSFGIHNINY
jgi:hypothetical protein